MPTKKHDENHVKKAEAQKAFNEMMRMRDEVMKAYQDVMREGGEPLGESRKGGTASIE